MVRAEVEIPEGVEVSIDFLGKLEGYKIKVKGPLGENERVLGYPGVEIRMDGNRIIIESKKDKKKFKALVNTYKAHIENMIIGVQKGFKYKLRAVYAHFPIKAKLEGDELVILNFMGERNPRGRRVKIEPGVKVELITDGEVLREIIVESIDIEKAGIVAGRIEQATRITKWDKRKFQDGIYIVEKPW